MSSIFLVIVSPKVWPGADTVTGSPIGWELSNPGIISIPLGFLGCYLGTMLSREKQGRAHLRRALRALGDRPRLRARTGAGVLAGYTDLRDVERRGSTSQRCEGGAGVRVLAVDDEHAALQDLERVLRRHRAVQAVDLAAGGVEALHALTARRYDAVFLDVRIPGVDGVELARLMRRFESPPALVFVSAYESAAVDAFALRAVDYLLKPVNRWRAHAALDRIEAQLSRPVAAGIDELLPVERPGRGLRLVARSSVLYAETHGHQVRVVASDGRFLLPHRLGELERRWAGRGFLRVHRRFVVNLQHAVELRPRLNGTAEIVLDDGSAIPIARRKLGDARRGLLGRAAGPLAGPGGDAPANRSGARCSRSA